MTMDIVYFLIDFILHLDKHLAQIILEYGAVTYFILFMIIFVETGVVLMPFLPGDSLLFAAGAFAAIGSFNILLLVGLLILAAFLGDLVNYYLGKKFGLHPFVVSKIKKEHLDKTYNFYHKYGAKTIILARFLPIFRTFAPFVAGIGKMESKKFITYNLIGGLTWVTSFCFLGYFFGNMPLVKTNFSLVIVMIIFISVLPVFIEIIKHRLHQSKINK